MGLIKPFPWILCAVLAGICWQQQLKHVEYKSKAAHKIASLELERLQLAKKTSAQSSQMKRQERNTSMELVSSQQVVQNTQQTQDGHTQPNQEQSMSEYDLDAMVEDRAWKRIEEIEEERREERFERITEHTQMRIQEWAEEYDWSQDTQESMMDIMTTFIRGRVDFHAQLKNGSIERDQIGPYVQKLAQERNEALVDLIGEEQFLELEDELKHRNGPPPPR